MITDGDPVRVNFGRPMPIFPLDGVVLLPHATIRLYIFEPRYRQMVSEVLDGAGLIAMAVFDGERWRSEGDRSPPIRPAVCIGHVVHHEGLPDGTSKIWIRGVCRARVVEDHEPDEHRLYRTALLAPAERGQPDEPDGMDPQAVQTVLTTLCEEPLAGLPMVRAVMSQMEAAAGELAKVPASALLDLVSLGVLAGLGDRELLYQILASPSPADRCGIVSARLTEMASILRAVGRQYDAEAPTGISWN
jgi:Lon protease-like protein